MERKFEIDAKTLVLIDRVFLPLNPNKLRKPDPEVKKAVLRFKALADQAREVLAATEPGLW